MSIKNVLKNKFMWVAMSFVALIVLAIIIVPPMLIFNNLKPKIEEVVLTQTGIPAKINGDVNFSLIGKVTIVAHDISVPNGVIDNINKTAP